MFDLDKAVASQLADMEKRSGKSLAERTSVVQQSGLTNHGELVSMLKSTPGMGHGDANLLVHVVCGTASQTVAAPASTAAAGVAVADVLDASYVGPMASLRAIHDALLPHPHALGTFEQAPKQGYMTLTDPQEVNAELFGWMAAAYSAAGS